MQHSSTECCFPLFNFLIKIRHLQINKELTRILQCSNDLHMATTDENSTFKRLQNRYRLVIMNDDTYEEVVTFKLSRMSVYIGLCTIFVLLVGLTIMLFILTPLKYYIPGEAASRQTKTELQALKMKTDSLEQTIKYKDQYLNSIKQVLTGNVGVAKDTATLKVPKPDISND